jgi:hypothetical protein
MLELKYKVKFMKLTLKTQTLMSGDQCGPLQLFVGIADNANIMLTKGMLLDHEPKKCKIFYNQYNMI